MWMNKWTMDNDLCLIKCILHCRYWCYWTSCCDNLYLVASNFYSHWESITLIIRWHILDWTRSWDSKYSLCQYVHWILYIDNVAQYLMYGCVCLHACPHIDHLVINYSLSGVMLTGAKFAEQTELKEEKSGTLDISETNRSSPARRSGSSDSRKGILRSRSNSTSPRRSHSGSCGEYILACQIKQVWQIWVERNQ